MCWYFFLFPKHVSKRTSVVHALVLGRVFPLRAVASVKRTRPTETSWWRRMGATSACSSSMEKVCGGDDDDDDDDNDDDDDIRTLRAYVPQI